MTAPGDNRAVYSDIEQETDYRLLGIRAISKFIWSDSDAIASKDFLLRKGKSQNPQLPNQAEILVSGTEFITQFP